MTRKPIVIAMFPVAIDQWAEALGLDVTLMPTEGYTKTKCHECNEESWIGPRQLEQYQSNPAPCALLCYPCIVGKYDGAVMMSLGNPNSAQIKPLP